MPEEPMDYPLLALDTSSRRTWVGLKQGPNELAFLAEERDPSKALFTLLERLLRETGLSLDALAAIAFCHGPGSMLGVRAACMAIRAWRGIGIPAAHRVFAFDSLRLGRLVALASDEPAGRLPGATLLTDARRASWNALPVSASSDQTIRILPSDELESLPGPLLVFPEFARWTKTEAELVEIPYRPELAFQDEAFLDLLVPSPNCEPLQIRRAEYKKWIPKIHSAPDA